MREQQKKQEMEEQARKDKIRLAQEAEQRKK